MVHRQCFRKFFNLNRNELCDALFQERGYNISFGLAG
jgi:hypothetical protein